MKKFLIASLSVAASAVNYEPSALKDEIVNLPGAPKVNFRMFSGYINVSSTRQLFYWFTESESPSAATDPVVVWTNGGPGCSGLSGFLTENGAFRPMEGGKILKKNPHSWNTVANTVFIEQPAGVGFSTINDPSYVYNDGDAAADNLQFIRGWLEKFPAYKANDLYITSESYGGHYMPTLANEVLENGSDITNFKGFAVGNPLTWMPYRNYGQFGTWAYHQLIPHPVWKKYESSGCIPPNITEAGLLSAAGATFDPPAVCGNLEDQMAELTQNMNPYALDFPTCLAEGSNGGNLEKAVFLKTIHRANKQLRAKRNLQNTAPDYFPDYEPCTDNWAADYLHRDDVITAIHAVAPAGGWAECNNDINANWSQQDVNAPMMYYYQKLIASGKNYNILIYSGDDDSVCATMGSQQFIWDLGLNIVDPWKQWTSSDGQVAGFHVQFDGLHFATVHGAGHMTPSTRPAQTLDMFKKFLNGTW